jgi:hypothetical protein
MARSRLDTLVSLAGSLSGAGPWTASESLAISVRARRGTQVVKPDVLDRALLALLFGFVGHSLILYRRHFDEMTHVLDLSAKRG